MADYFTQFSCQFDVGSADNAERALAIFVEMQRTLEDDDGVTIGFEADMEPDHPSVLWLHSGGGFGEPEHVIAFVLRCAEVFDLKGRWGFVWALSCSKPRLDGCGGGAQLLDLGARKSLVWIDCDHWLTAMLDPASAPDDGLAFA